ncbi:HugZ family pyridoxamine 5'-phosphate oxidase [Spongorhabdus nitratireducens]
MAKVDSAEQMANTMSTNKTIAPEARGLLLSEYQGVLATQSRVLPGYPFGSVTPYCLDQNGQPIILISSLAQHTRNIDKDPKVSLTLTESNVDDAQTGARLTWVGDAHKVEGDDAEAVAERYYRFFPHSKGYHKTHSFAFYRIEAVRARYIGGFGRIHWVSKDDISGENPFFGDVEAGMVNHMNEDHQDALVKYCIQNGVEVPEGVQPLMAGIDSEGIHLLIERRLVRIAFETPVTTPGEARQALVAMARAA